MAFWDDITKSAKDAAAFTVKKTEELTTLAKLKLSLKGEETKLEGCFKNIGELYYLSAKNGTDNTQAIAEFSSSADEISAAIAELKSKINAIQNTYVCEVCGASFDADFKFCPKCGAAKKATEDSEKEKPEENTEE